MRGSALLAAALLVSLVPFAPTASAAPLLTDAKGDVAFQTTAGPLAASGQPTDGADLLALDVAESADEITFVVTTVATGSTMGLERLVYFTWNGEPYRVNAQSFSSEFGGPNNGFAYLERLEDDDYEPVADLEMTTDATTVTVPVPRVFILDREDRPPFRGASLTDVYVEAKMCCSIRISGNSAQAADSMPDDPAAAASFTLQIGEEATGNVRLDSLDPVRVSNGGATTFVFKVTVLNKGEKEDEYTLSIVDLPEGWNATVQSPVKVDGKDEKTVSVLASVPFEHKHGGFDSFNVTATSKTDPNSRASTRLGVVHTPIPQPAGHHPDLFLHAKQWEGGFFGQVFSTAFPFNYGYMNTDSEREEGEVASVSQNFCDENGCGWYIPLEPALAMGLDFDLARVGTLAGAILPGGSGTADLTATLVLYTQSEEDRDGIPLAESKPAKVTLDLQNPSKFQVDLIPTPDSDYVAYSPEQSLALQVTLDNEEGVPTFGIKGYELNTADFLLTLPLNEYHDKLSGVSEESGPGLEIVADGDVEKAAKPGSTLAYLFDVKNGGTEDLTLEVDVAGTDAHIGRLVPEGTVTVAAGESRRVTLAVTIPSEANEGEEFEVLVFAHDETDPSIMAIARTKTVATFAESASADETEVVREAQSAEERDTPATGLVATLSLLAGLAIALRRR